MPRRARLLRTLTIPTILLVGGCESFTLVGAVNLGGIGPETPQTDEADGDGVAVCWPVAKEAFAEMVAHGFTPKRWSKTEAWFTALEPVKNSLPTCEQEDGATR